MFDISELADLLEESEEVKEELNNQSEEIEDEK